MATKWFGGILGGGSDPMEILADLARNKTPVRVEIEGTLIKFHSQLTLKKGSVVLAKPLGLKDGLTSNSFVRIRLPGSARRELRLNVVTPHFNLTTGNAVFLCDVPKADVEARRSADRYDVTRYNNLRLVMTSGEFRLIDVSASGFRVMAGQQANEHFPIGRELGSAHIMLGANARVDLDRIVPRAHHGSAVGCEFAVSKGSASERYLTHLLDSLTKAEMQRMSTAG